MAELTLFKAAGQVGIAAECAGCGDRVGKGVSIDKLVEEIEEAAEEGGGKAKAVSKLVPKILRMVPEREFDISVPALVVYEDGCDPAG